MALSAPDTPQTDRRIILGVVCLAALVLPFDFSGAAAATPAIGRAFGGTAVMLAWVVNAFMLTFGSTLLTAGALADVFGRKRVFATGIAAFVVVSIAIAFAPNLLVLDLLRACQGLAAAATLAGGSAALAQEFDGQARTRAFSLLGTTFGTGLAFGPTIAGLLIASWGWRSIFLVSAAIGAVALAFGVPRMRETCDPRATGPDLPGAATFTAALTLFTAVLLQASQTGWASPTTIAGFVGTAILISLFVRIECSASNPMLDLSLFRYTRFIGVQALPIATCYSYVVLLVILPARLIGIEGYQELAAGLLMLALSVPMLVVPFITALLTRWFSPGLLSASGLVIAAAGLWWLADVPLGAPALRLATPMMVIGFGTAMPWGLMDGLSVSIVPTERAGMATGVFSTVRVAGEGIALAVVRSILAGLLQSGLATASRPSEATATIAAWVATGDLSRVTTIAHGPLVQAYGAAFRSLAHILAGIVLVSSVVVFVCLREASRQLALKPLVPGRPDEGPQPARRPSRGRCPSRT